MKFSFSLILLIASLIGICCVASRNEEELLIQYSKNGNLNGIRELIKNGVNVNVNEELYKTTALKEACIHGHGDAVELFIENGANVTEIDWIGNTLLHTASYHGHINIVRILVKHGANVNAKGDYLWTPLHSACQNITQHVNLIRTLIEFGANVNAEDYDKSTPLHECALYGTADSIRILVEFGANIDAEDKFKLTPIFRPIPPLPFSCCFFNTKDRVDKIRTLIELGANMNIQHHVLKITPLHKCVFLDQVDIVRLLVENGANVNLKYSAGWTPLQLAISRDRRAIVQILKEAEDKQKSGFLKFIKKTFKKIFKSKA